VTGSDVSHVIGNDVIAGRDVTGFDVIFPALFSYYSSSTKCPIVVCHSIYGFCLFLWYLLVIVLFVIRFTASAYSFGIFWSLCCLSFDLQLLIIPLVSSSFTCKETFCTTTIVKKKRKNNVTSGHMTTITSGRVMTSLPVTSLPITWLPVMSFPVAHLSRIMLPYRSSKQSSTDQTPNMPQ
jgi:hypothetical protein